MYLKTVQLRSFRNYREQQVNFESQKTIIVGNNAQGKSNLLEAVELLATLKSHRVSRDRDLVLEGATTGQILATLERAYGLAELGLILRVSGRRTVILNQEPLRRQLDFLGVLNAVQFSSLDLDLVRGSPESRRSWIDTLLVQLEPIYAHILSQYYQVLKQRNALLKKIRQQEEDSQNPSLSSEQLSNDISQLKLWDSQLAETGSRVTRRRARVLERLTPLAQKWHANISGKTEQLEIQYMPNVNWTEDEPMQVQQAFLEKIEKRRIAEQQLGTTVVGPHRDEIEFIINQTPAKYYGSQGQQRTLVLALKLAELHLIEEVVGEPPLLLLDDVLAELDPHRQNQLLDAIEDRFQTLITTTHLNSFETKWLKSSQILSIDGGQIRDF
ncbi:DNA replication and repair protein RecF [Gloeothece citriformis PCC 7424]|uniref:DNA replication and repair protein RecF n=1 Tax=Gloeothece citriformis (strain PCC 7424) TaxID=65393 RepID=RECF_GLOC7|nr:DNA replication/repair protein RecF [Gloeothece citriformis]B7KID4.1 RecName: Full=DNA replication and repair protein RecF [Gloeothece citriformis PCC 7424]ACK73621.1 DNA replication and repair protein RecF [Gloeothece citriformis PCC 7424]